jgi:hypothetical protein
MISASARALRPHGTTLNCVNIEFSALTDKDVARNVNISFNINAASGITTDILTFIIYSDTFTIDIETGSITK